MIRDYETFKENFPETRKWMKESLLMIVVMFLCLWRADSFPAFNLLVLIASGLAMHYNVKMKAASDREHKEAHDRIMAEIRELEKELLANLKRINEELHNNQQKGD